MSTFFRGITEAVPSLFRGIFSERNSVPNPNQSVCPFVGIGSPPSPSPQASVSPSQEPKGRRATLPCGWGGGGDPIRTTGQEACDISYNITIWIFIVWSIQGPAFRIQHYFWHMPITILLYIGRPSVPSFFTFNQPFLMITTVSSYCTLFYNSENFEHIWSYEHVHNFFLDVHMMQKTLCIHGWQYKFSLQIIVNERKAFPCLL